MLEQKSREAEPYVLPFMGRQRKSYLAKKARR